MKRYFTMRYALITGLVLLGAGFYLYNLLPDRNQYQYTYIPGTQINDSDSSAAVSDHLDSDNSTEPNTSQVTAVPTQTPEADATALTVRGATISLGESESSILKKLGAPGRIDETEYGFDYYVYNNDYSRLLFVAIEAGAVVGYYSDSLDFDFQGITSGSGLNTVNHVLGTDFAFSDLLSLNKEGYTINILMDSLVTHKVTGIYVLPEAAAVEEYTENAMKDNELIVYDLTNSIRVRNQKSILSWSSSAALSARKHSLDMAKNDFFGHINHKLENAGDRMRTEGIYYKICGENIIGGYGSAILSTHKWFNSTAQRKNLLSSEFRYIGVGFAYVADSKYQTYITQNFYR